MATWKVSVDTRTTFDVVGGMTHKALIESTTVSSNLYGPRHVVKSRKVVTVAEAR